MLKNKVEINNLGTRIIIKINDLIHLNIRLPVLAIHSYLDEVSNTRVNAKDAYYTLYYINFHLDSGQMIHCEYNDRELWETILKGLE